MGLEWRPFDNLLLRGTYATSFRAPDMHFVYADPSESVADQVDYLACFSDPDRQTSNCPGGVGEPYHIDNPLIARQGTEDLLYETGDSLTYGFVWDAFEGFSISADYWRVNIENAIDDVGADQVLLDEAYCLTGLSAARQAGRRTPPSQAAVRPADQPRDRVTRNGVVTRVEIGPINRAKQSVSGVDVASRYSLQTESWGTFDFALNYTRQLTYKFAQFPGDLIREHPRPGTADALSRPRQRHLDPGSLDRGAVRGLDRGHPQRPLRRLHRAAQRFPPGRGHRLHGSARERDGERSISYGQQSELVDFYNQDKIYWNASVGYQATDALRLNFYVNNILDDHFQDKWCGGFAYCVSNPIGREVAAEIVYKFD